MRLGKHDELSPIGLDLGGGSIKLLQLERTGGGVAVRAAAQQPWGAGAHDALDYAALAPSLEAMVGRMLASAPFIGRQVVAALPREALHHRTIRLPILPPDRLEAAVRGEARSLFAFARDAVIQFLPTAQVRQGNDLRLEVIVLAARRAEVDGFTRALHAAGLIVDSLDAEPCALYRHVERFLPADDRDVHALIDVGMRQSQVVMGRGPDITFIKSVDVGSQHFDASVARKLGVPANEARLLRQRLNAPATAAGMADAAGWAFGGREDIRQAVVDATRGPMEHLGRELGAFLKYHAVAFRGRPPARIRLLGGEAADPHLVAVLNAAVPAPVEATCPLASVAPGAMPASQFDGPMGHWAVALGLALKKMRLPAPAEQPQAVAPAQASHASARPAGAPVGATFARTLFRPAASAATTVHPASAPATRPARTLQPAGASRATKAVARA